MKTKILFVCMIILLAQGAWCAGCGQEETVFYEQDTAGLWDTEQSAPDELLVPAFCCVYVCGAVKNPGVYTLDASARIWDAIEMAGGFTEDAAQQARNLAEMLVDGEQIVIPTVEEWEEEKQQLSEQQEWSAESQASQQSGRINLNTATRDELMSIPGVGEAKADSIIQYRQQHGSFTTVEQIKEISGIKDGLFEKMKDSITVD